MFARTVSSIENRINLLTERDPVMNQNIINKLKRKIRAMTSNK